MFKQRYERGLAIAVKYDIAHRPHAKRLLKMYRLKHTQLYFQYLRGALSAQDMIEDFDLFADRIDGRIMRQKDVQEPILITQIIRQRLQLA